MKKVCNHSAISLRNEKTVNFNTWIPACAGMTEVFFILGY
jgi:hypothetical protein